jgi:hypothetical protein
LFFFLSKYSSAQYIISISINQKKTKSYLMGRFLIKDKIYHPLPVISPR